jgi:hypothetical protein
MKKNYIFIMMILLLGSMTSFSQTPDKMSYQAIIRDASGALVTNQLIGMRISILSQSSSGNTVFTQNLNTTTNSNGLATLEIGGGLNFNNIQWENGPFYIKTETDITGGSNYTITSTSQLLTVPYALYAKKSGGMNVNGMPNQIVKFADATTLGSSLLFDNGMNIGVATTNPTKRFDVNGAGMFTHTSTTIQYSDASLITKSTPTSVLWASIGFDNDAGSLHGQLSFNGQNAPGTFLFVNAAGTGLTNCQAQAFQAVSDIRLKKDITNITDMEIYLEKIRNIQPITYRFKEEDNTIHPHIGFVAQTLPNGVKTRIPSLHKGESASDYFSVNLTDMSALLLIGVKAIDNQITTLEKIVEDQQKIIDTLIQRIEYLEKK